MKRKKIIWEKQEAGWYTSVAGGICGEKKGWYFYPFRSGNAVGPIESLGSAKIEAGRWWVNVGRRMK